MIHPCQSFWGMTAMGEIFRFRGWRRWTSSQRMISLNPAFNLVGDVLMD
jgi:hypothetical protein